MTSRSHYAAQQAAQDAENPAIPPTAAPRYATTGRVTIGSFTGRWRIKSSVPSGAHLINQSRQTRCGLDYSSQVLAAPRRWSQCCPYCINPAYCPDCGDTTTAGHKTDCCYGGQL